MADLTSLANVKQWLGLTATDHDTLLSSLVSGVSAWIEKHLSRTIAATAYTETLNGSGLPHLFVVNSPIISVSSVVVDGSAIPARAGVGQRGYTFDKDAIYLDGYCFTRGIQNVVLGYSSGFAIVPVDLELAAKKLCAIGYRERDRIGLSSKGLGGEQTNFIVRFMPQDVEAILESYVRVPVIQ